MAKSTGSARPRRRRLAESEIDDLVRRYLAGEGVKPLAAAFGTSQHRTRRALLGRGVVLRTASEAASLVQAANKIRDGLTANQRRGRRQRAAGLCLHCDSPPLPGRVFCGRCRGRTVEASRRARNRRLEAGLCTGCGRQAAPGRQWCQACLDRDRRLRRERKAAGLCVGCAVPNPGASLCPKCLAQRARCDLRLKVETFEAYGGCRCACCGEANLALLTLDHVGGDGAAHRRALGKRGTGRSFRRELRARGYPPGLQVLCGGCNFAKRTGAECPHQQERRQMLQSLASVPLTY